MKPLSVLHFIKICNAVAKINLDAVEKSSYVCVAIG